MANGLTKATKEDAGIQALRVNRTAPLSREREMVGRSIGRGYESDYLEGITVSDTMRYQDYLRKMAQRVSKRDTLRKYQSNKCCWCGKQMQRERPKMWDYETIEHLKPLSKGGTDSIANLALAHQKCNWDRGTEEREPLLRRVAATKPWKWV